MTDRCAGEKKALSEAAAPIGRLARWILEMALLAADLTVKTHAHTGGTLGRSC